MSQRGIADVLGCSRNTVSPETVFVADFMGVENIFSGTSGARGWTSQSGLVLPVADADTAHVGVRPTEIDLIDPEPERVSDRAVSFPVAITGRTYLGNSVRYQTGHSGQRVIVEVPQTRARFEVGDRASAVVGADSVLPLRDSKGNAVTAAAG